MWFPADPGTTWRLCFDDSSHETADGAVWTPSTRHTSDCWTSAGTAGIEVEKAADIAITSVGQRKKVTLRLPNAGKALTPSTPYLTGATTAGTSLRVDPGPWSQSGPTFGYRWLAYAQDGTRLGTVATTRTFTPPASLAGRLLRAEVTARRSGYAPMTVGVSAGVVGLPAPTVHSALTITGTVAPGRALTATHGAVAPSTSVVSYSWYVDGRYARSGATFALTTAHRTRTLSVRASYATGSNPSEHGQRHQQAAVRVPGLAFTAGTPTISGTAVVGRTLTARRGSWSPTPSSYSYRWLRDGTAIVGATASTYTLTKADRGTRIQVEVTGKRSGYDSASRTSARTASVKGVLTSAHPTIVGTRTVGRTLRVEPGTWKPAPVTLTYRWYRDGEAISGATRSTHTLTRTDRGTRIHVRVTGTKSGYVTAARTSARTSTIR